MKTFSSLAILALTSTLALTACSEEKEAKPAPKPSTSASASAAPSPEASESSDALSPEEELFAEGAQEVTTPFFLSMVPSGWENVTQEAQAADSRALLAYRTPTADENGFKTNVNVVRLKLDRVYSEEALFAIFAQELASMGAELKGEPEKISVGGAKGYLFSSTHQGRHIDQVQVTRNGYSFVATSTSSDEATSRALLSRFVEAWFWLD